MDGVLFRCRVRGTTREGDRVRLSLNWIFARRAYLVLTGTALVCGDWVIPYAEIEDAVLVSLGAHWRLIVRGREKVYQFIIPPITFWSTKPAIDPFWDGPLPFPLRRLTGHIEPRSQVLGFLACLGVLLVALWLVGAFWLVDWLVDSVRGPAVQAIFRNCAVAAAMVLVGLWLTKRIRGAPSPPSEGS
jgi:hypothetical protein